MIENVTYSLSSQSEAVVSAVVASAIDYVIDFLSLRAETRFCNRRKKELNISCDFSHAEDGILKTIGSPITRCKGRRSDRAEVSSKHHCQVPYEDHTGTPSAINTAVWRRELRRKLVYVAFCVRADSKAVHP